jgi:molybdate transport system substrate-binding protein
MLSKAGRLFNVVFLITFVLACLLPADAAQRPVRRDLLVATAASLSPVSAQLARAFHDAHGVDIRFNFAGSNTLARQIIEGARVDVFISADETQMDAVENAGRLVLGTRFNLLGNRLMVILMRPRAETARPFRLVDLGEAGVRRIAMGDPDAVPVGVYGREWLQRLGLWSVVAAKVVRLPSSPAVVAAVREGRAQAGIVYYTDVEHGAYVAPASEGPRIVYPAAAVAGARQADARVFLDFLRGAVARRIFESARFSHLPE